ncbi:MAG: hypothetical protein JXO22_12080 [Phycisphaerae bacterium]|nr:hypothetical protein [Phycisphaerae bacterium]
MRRWLGRKRVLWLAATSGVCLEVLSGCDQQDTLISGFGAAMTDVATTLITALTERFLGTDASGASTPLVNAIAEQLPAIFA